MPEPQAGRDGKIKDYLRSCLKENKQQSSLKRQNVSASEVKGMCSFRVPCHVCEMDCIVEVNQTFL